MNYDIFCKLTEFLDIKSISTLTSTCRTLKSFKKSMQTLLLARTFRELDISNVYERLKTGDNIIKNSNFLTLMNKVHYYIFPVKTVTVTQKIVIDKILILLTNIRRLPFKRSNFQLIDTLFNECLYVINLTDINLNILLINGNLHQKSLLLKRIFNSSITELMESKPKPNFNLQSLFNAIILLQNIEYLNLFYYLYNNSYSHLLITREQIRKLVADGNINFFNRLVNLFLGDFIKMNLYQQAIKEGLKNNLKNGLLFSEYIKMKNKIGGEQINKIGG